MKRHGNLYEKIYDIDNLRLADANARKGKKNQYGIRLFDKDKEANLLSLHLMLKNKTYKTSPYTTFTIHEPKERIVFRLPYFPDRILHHAIMLQIEKILNSVFTADTYSSIKGKGIHAMSEAIKKCLRNVSETTYCLQFDIEKFYPSINHDKLKELLRRKFKDKNLLWLLDEIIDSTAGLPIGNYLSQPLANFYLTYFDHWIKEKMQVAHYFRYCDDIPIFHKSKAYLHKLLFDIRNYLKNELKLTIKYNYQIFKVAIRGANVVGYQHFHFYTLIRDTIKKEFAKMLVYRKNIQSISSYRGWMLHCDSNHLMKKLLPSEGL